MVLTKQQASSFKSELNKAAQSAGRNLTGGEVQRIYQKYSTTTGSSQPQSSMSNPTPAATTNQTVASVKAQTQAMQEQKVQQLINSGEIQGFSGTNLTPEQIAVKNLYEGIGAIPATPTYGEYLKAITPEAQNLLSTLQPRPSTAVEMLKQQYETAYQYAPKPNLQSGAATPITANDVIIASTLALEGANLLAGRAALSKLAPEVLKKLYSTTPGKILLAGIASGEVVAPTLTNLDKSFLPQPISIPGRFTKAAIEGAVVASSPFLEGVYLEQIGKSIITNPEATVESAIKNYPETLGFVVGGGVKVKAQLSKLEINNIRESPFPNSFTREMEASIKGTPGMLEVSYGVPFTSKTYTLDLLRGEYSKSLDNIPPEFAQEKATLESLFSKAKGGVPLAVGELRLERLKELPKDKQTLDIIENFFREKGIIVGGTTAIETLRVGGEPINLRRVPRDLEGYDPLKRSSSDLARELYERLKNAGKDVTLEGNTIGFKGIEGHGVNFQNIDRLNIERYRYKIWTTKSGIKIADPLSTAYNKVADLLKNAELGTSKAKKIAEKLGKPELISKATAAGRIYERYPKDVVGALSTITQVIDKTLKHYQDLTRKQTPIYQEYQQLKFGYAKELAKPYLSKLVEEEAQAIAYFYTGKKPGILSGKKYVKSYTFELERRILTEKRASTSLLGYQEKLKGNLSKEYEYLGKKIRENLNYPKIAKVEKINYPKIKTENYEKNNAIENYNKEIYKNVANYPGVKQTKNSPNEEYPKEDYPIEGVKTNYPKARTPTKTNASNYPTNIPTPRIPEIKIPKIVIIPLEEKKQVKRKTSESGYNVYGKMVRSNNFFKINTAPVSHSRAEDIGAYYVLNTLARTFTIKRASGTAEQDFQFMYVPEGYAKANARALREFKIRRGKAINVSEQYIQRTPSLLQTPGEKAQIKAFQKQVKNLLR